MKCLLKEFHQSEDGAVTVDWMLLTAALLTLGIVVGYAVSDGAETMAQNTGNELATADIPEVSFQ